ncbi:hypothetical protein E2C01_083412 [Portunus trituberculatus]|uniref:Uncharacterized protein n=1 Tax=Portunus trituberculatus TaxID=210409 RepID=A0A5B7J3E9_PORTR|nr:hypothetical protein [Portunus trituberculatus]
MLVTLTRTDFQYQIMNALNLSLSHGTHCGPSGRGGPVSPRSRESAAPQFPGVGEAGTLISEWYSIDSYNGVRRINFLPVFWYH